LDRSAPAKEFANLIMENYQNREAYLQFRRAARDAYENTFNWQRWAATIHEISRELVAKSGAGRNGD